MSPAQEFGCPWCDHESDDRTTFRTHLLVEHRKSDIVEFVLESFSSEESTSATEPVAQ